MRLIKWKDYRQDNSISANGQRTAKHVYSSSDVFEHSDYYVYDASGNLMSVYRKFSDANEQVLSYSLTERPMYGSSRLGVDKTTIEFIGYTPPTNGLTNHVVGLKQYEGSNHLGNVLTTFSDKKMPVDANSDGIIDYSTADITSSTDYYPFGVTMKARDFTSNVSRFGFNGKEKDEETETMDFGARLLDGDLGVWLACDPSKNRYPGHSPYNYALNSPIFLFDPNGKWVARIDCNSEGYYSLTFVAENGDNIETLSKQLGIPIGSLVELDPTLVDITITTGTELKLECINEVQEINNGINIIAKNQTSTNCANLADYCDGETNVQDVINGNNVDILAEKLKNEYSEIDDSQAKIGDMMTYRLDNLDRQREYEGEQSLVESYNLASETCDLLLKSAQAKIDKIYNSERHFTVLILKSKDGNSPAQMIQKHGTSPFDFKVSSADDTRIEGSVSGRLSQVNYTRTSLSGSPNSTYTKK